MNQLKIILQAVIDQSSLSNVQKDLLKKKYKIDVNIDSSGVTKLATDLQRITKANSMQTWMTNNSKATKQFGTDIQTLITKLRSVDDMTIPELKKIDLQFKQIQLNARSLGKTGLTFSDSIKKGFSSFTSFLSKSSVVMTGANATRNAAISIKELDTELADLQKTTNITASTLKKFYYDANETAKLLGVTTKGIISQTNEWSRLGFTIKEAATMAENSAILEAISPDLDIQSSTDTLVSTLKAFKLEADDSLDGIISKINIIGNTQAVSNGDIADILTRSSSAMAAANNTLEQTIALGTAATEITRDASAVGTALKTISMRIRGYDEETEEYIGNLEELSGTIAALTKSASTPGGISLFTDDTKETYKSTYQILDDISSIWDKLTDKNQDQLLEALAGKRQGQVVSSMISNFEAAEKSMDSMSNSAGNAMSEMEIIYDSLDYKLNRLRETGIGIAQNLFNRDEMKSVVDGLTKVAEVIDFVTEKLGLFGTMGVGAGIFAGFKNIGKYA